MYSFLIIYFVLCTYATLTLAVLFVGYMKAVTDEMLIELKSCFMEAYDDNQDGKIDIREVCVLMPMKRISVGKCVL